MKSSKILSILLIIVFVYVFFRTYTFKQAKEMFLSSCYPTRNPGCYYEPMGKSRDACVLRCIAGSESWGGKEECTEEKCEELCLGVTNPTVPENREGILKNKLMIVTFNKGANVYYNDIKHNSYLEYHLTGNKIDGVYYKKLKPNKKMIKIRDLQNKMEYSFRIVKEEDNSFKPDSETTTATCSSNDKLLSL